MEWIVLLGLVAAILIFVNFRKPHQDLSMLPSKFIIFDLETTGLNAKSDEIIEIGAIRVNRDSNTHDTFQALIRSDSKISKDISELTGITQEMIDSKGEPLEQVFKDFMNFIGDHRVVAYNAEFDVKFIKSTAEKFGVKFDNDVSCALKMARRAWPSLKSYKLSELAKNIGISNKGAHRALIDCEITIHVYVAAASILKSLK
jgi:DNA polymerase III subunit epsilon